MKHLFLSCLCHESQGLCDWKPSSVSSRTWSTYLSAQDSPAILGGNEVAKFSPTLWTSSQLFPPPSKAGFILDWERIAVRGGGLSPWWGTLRAPSGKRDFYNKEWEAGNRASLASHWLCPWQQRSLLFSLLGSANFSGHESSPAPVLVPQVCLIEASVYFLHTHSFIISVSLQMMFEDVRHCDHRTLSREVLWQCHSHRRGSCLKSFESGHCN